MRWIEKQWQWMTWSVCYVRHDSTDLLWPLHCETCRKCWCNMDSFGSVTLHRILFELQQYSDRQSATQQRTEHICTRESIEAKESRRHGAPKLPCCSFLHMLWSSRLKARGHNDSVNSEIINNAIMNTRGSGGNRIREYQYNVSDNTVFGSYAGMHAAFLSSHPCTKCIIWLSRSYEHTSVANIKARDDLIWSDDVTVSEVRVCARMRDAASGITARWSRATGQGVEGSNHCMSRRNTRKRKQHCGSSMVL